MISRPVSLILCHKQKKIKLKKLDLVAKFLIHFLIIWPFGFSSRFLFFGQIKPAGKSSHGEKGAETQSELCARACI